MFYDISERAFQFAKQVVLFINGISFTGVNRSTLDQLIRSATSIGANIIEARSGNSRRNMISFYSIALRSANESHYWLRLINETMNVDHHETELLMKECSEIANIIGKSIVTLKQNVQSKS